VLMFILIGVAVLVVIVAVGVYMAKGSRIARRSGADVQATGRVDVIERPGSPR
jgi:hypothetical protein